MRLILAQGDLFGKVRMTQQGGEVVFMLSSKEVCPEEHPVAIVHCISADAAMGKGFALQVARMLGTGLRTSIIASHPSVGETIFRQGIFHMVTKLYCWQKPARMDFMTALSSLASMVSRSGYKWLIMPKIGCGLDGLDWKWVQDLIEQAFSLWDGTIVVCV